MVKVVSLFLIGMLVLAMFGRLRIPKIKKDALSKPKKCTNCGTPLIGKQPCDCQTSAK